MLVWAVNLRVARNPPRIDPECGDHFLQADLSTDPHIITSGLLPNHPECRHPRATCCAGYNYAHAWHSAVVQDSVLTKSNRRWAQAAWERFIVQKIRVSGAM